MAKKKRKGLQVIGGILKAVIPKLIPGGHILENVMKENDTPAGSYDKAKTWPDIAWLLGQIVLYILALKYFEVDISDFLG